MPATPPARLQIAANSSRYLQLSVYAPDVDVLDHGKETAMVNLSDITREAGRGVGLDLLSRQFNLDPAQTGRAIEVLLPAFTLAFQRLMLNPAAFADFTKTVTSGSYASFFDNPGRADAAANGATVVDQLFRSPEATRQVASQAAALTGVGVQVMQQLMPTLAATLVGGIFRYATVEGFAGLLRQWGDALKTASETMDPPKPQDPWSVWQRTAGQLMGLQPAPKKEPEPAGVFDAWVAMVGAMMQLPSASSDVSRSGTSATAHKQEASPGAVPTSVRRSESEPAGPDGESAEDQPEHEKTASPDKDANPFEAMSQMFETGRDMHAQHVAAFQSILDNVWGSGAKT